MTDRTVTVRMRMDVGSAVAAARTYGAAVGDMAKKTVAGAAGMSRAIDEASGRQKQAYDSVSRKSTIVAVGLVGAFALATKATMSFDKAMSSVAANSGAHGAALNSLRQAAIAAGRDTAFSATQAAHGEDELAKAGVSVTDVVHGGLKGALSLAAAGQISVGDAAETAATAMTQFKLSGAAVPHIADLLSAAANKAQGSVGDMGAALKQGGLVASQFGLSIEDTVGTLGAFASAGLIGSDAGTSLKTMLLSLANPSTQATATMKQLGLSAYDASGKFVGVTALAGELHDKLGGLSQAQRDAALATIFGSDAIRSANVLYQQGAGGIQGWINKVNDTGNAARTAATKMNNLSGDLEQLKGSLETALIQGGSQANGSLRSLVQTATAAVNAFSALPGPVQGSAVVLAGVSGAGILAAKGILSVVGTVRDAKDAWIGFRAAMASGEGTTGRLGTMVKGAAGAIIGPLGIALAGGAALLGVWIARQEAARARLASLTDAVTKDAGAIGTNTRAWMVNELEHKKFTDSGQSVMQAAKGMGLNLSQVTDAMLGQGTASQQLQQQLQAQIDAQTALWHSGRLGTEQYKERISAAQEMLGILRGENGDLNKASQAARDHAAAMAQGTTAQQQAAVAAVRHASDEQTLAAAMTDATKTADDLKAALDALAKGNMDADQAAIDQAKAAQAAAKASDHRRRVTLDEKGALISLADADQKQLVAMKANGATGDQLTKKMSSLRAGFIATAEKMGLTSKAARDLANRYGLIPGKKTTTISSNASAQAKAVQDYQNKLNSLHGKTISVHTIYTASGSTTIGAGNKKLGNARGGPIHRAYGGAVGMADGGPSGPVVGPGSGTSDDIPVWLSNGEYVINARQAGRHRDLLDAINKGVQGFARGGQIGYATGGSVSTLDLSSVLSDWTTAVNPASKSDVTAATKARTTQVNQLKAAEDALYRARKAHDPRAIAAAERRIRAERDDLAAATKKLRDVEQRYKYARQSPATQLGSALGLGIKNTGTFIKNLTTLSDRGFGTLANALLQMGGPQAEKIASDAVKFSAAKLGKLQGQVTQSQQQQDQLANLPALLTTRSAIKAGKGGSWVGLLNATGLTPDVLAIAVKSMLTDLTKTDQGKALIADMHAHGYAAGGLIGGVGGPRSDSNVIAASRGEYMVNAASTARYRPWVEAINSDRLGEFVRHLVSGGSGGRAPAVSGTAAQAGATVHNTFHHRDMDVHELARNVAAETAWALK